MQCKRCANNFGISSKYRQLSKPDYRCAAGIYYNGETTEVSLLKRASSCLWDHILNHSTITRGMANMQKSNLTIQCVFSEDGEELQTLIEKAFQAFLRAELGSKVEAAV